MATILVIALFVILLIVLLYGLSGLIIWGIGSLICMAFNLDFEFTYLMGLAVALGLSVLSGIIKANIEIKD